MSQSFTRSGIIVVEKNGTEVGARPRINLIEGNNVTLTVADDPTNSEVDVTITSTAGGGSPLTTKGDLYGYDTSDARLPVGTDRQILKADSGETTGLRWADAPVFNVLDYGAVGDGTTDDSTAMQNAINAAIADAGTVYIPPTTNPGTTYYSVPGGLDIDNFYKGLKVLGAGWGSQLVGDGTDSVIRIGSTGDVSGLVIADLRVDNYGAGYAAIEIDGNELSQSTIRDCYLFNASATGHCITGSGNWGMYDVLWLRNVYSGDGTAFSVPLVELIDPQSGWFNNVQFVGGRTIGSATSTGGAHFYFESQGGGSYDYKNVIEKINFEIPNYGAVHVEGGHSWAFRDLGFYDLGSFNANMIHLDKYSTGNASIKNVIENCHTISSTSRGSYYDIFIDGTGSGETVIINSGGHLSSSGKIDLNGKSAILINPSADTIDGATAATIMYPDRFELDGVKIDRGSGSPESVVTAPVGSIYQRTDGGSGTTLYVKESGAGNTGWVAHGSGGGASDLNDLTDVTIDTPLDGQYLVYDGATPMWRNVSPASTTFHTYALEGTLATGTGTYRIPITTAQTIVTVRVMVAVAPTGGSIVCDVNKNGTSIYPTSSKPTITATNNDSGNTAPDTTALAAGDYLTVDVDSVGTGGGQDGILIVEVTVP